MKFDIFKEKYLDLLIINNKSIDYFKITHEKEKVKVVKSARVEAEIYSQGVFHFPNLEPALQILFQKHKLNELGIILNLPNIIYQKITLPRGSSPKDAIIHYLKTNFPLPIEKYALFYKEDKYRTLPTLATFNVFLISKEIIDSILAIIEKYNLIPLFISPSIEISFQYLLNKAVLDFNEEYLIFVLEENTLIACLIRNLRLEKVVLEEYEPQKINIDLLISRVYVFFKQELNPATKIIFFLEKKEDLPEITHEKMFWPSKPTDVLLEGGYLVFTNVLAEKQIIDFLPLKNYTAYFLNRIPSIVMFLSAYLVLLSLLISASYFVLQNHLQKKIKNISLQVKSLPLDQNLQTEIETLSGMAKKLNLETFSKFSSIEKIRYFQGLQSINFTHQGLTFAIKIPKQDIEKIKFQLSKDFPNAKLIEETSLENEVILKYSL
jgi:hypothetical protein